MPAPDRRAFLLAGLATGALIVAGCSADEPEPEAIEIEPTAPAEPDANLVDEFALIAAYAGAIAAFPELRGTLTTIADQHRAHARELGASETDLAGIEPIAPDAARVRPAVTELIKRERAAARLRAESTIGDLDAETIRALTFIGASEASHVPELQDVRRGLGGGS